MKDRLARLARMMEKAAEHDLITAAGMTSVGDVLRSVLLIRFSTSSGVTGVKLQSGGPACGESKLREERLLEKRLTV